MKLIIAIYIIAVTFGPAHSYSIYGSAKRRSNSMLAPMMPMYSQLSTPQQQYYDSRSSTNYLQPQQMQYLSVPYMQQQQQPSQQQQQRMTATDDYNYRTNPSYFYYPQQRDYQETLYGIPTYHGEYNPKPYYFARPSYMTEDDRLETTNPLDYLHEEILEENERARNNAAFMQNLALYNKQLDSLQGRQQQMQQIQDLYNLKPASEFDDDYEMEQPNDWYDQTAILMDPSTYDSYMPEQKSQQLHQQQPQPQYLQRPVDYDDEMVKELKELKENRKNHGRSFEMPIKQQQQLKQQPQMYSNLDWQQDVPSENEDEDVMEPENYDDEWINWGGQKRSIQPKKDISLEGKQAQTIDKQLLSLKASSKSATVTTSKPLSSTMSSSTSTTKNLLENSKLLGKLHKGQKEVVLPRPATPVRRPFSESIMKSLGSQSVDEKQSSSEQTAPIYKTIKQIIDMEQNLSHLSDNQLPTSKIRKRFVTNEEALAQQLNGLKRTSK